jgi:hypothetical protein
MQELCIPFQHNTHPRDLVYELSASYLVARAIHLAAKLRLTSKLSTHGTTYKTLIAEFVDYEKSGITLLVDILVAYSIIDMRKDNILYPTPISYCLDECSKNLAASETDWRDSFDIVTFLNTHNVKTQEVRITIKDNSLFLYSTSGKALIFELAQLHYLTRAIRATTTAGIFENYPITDYPLNLKEQHIIFKPLLRLLSRYQLLHYDDHNNTLQLSTRCQFLVKDNTESLYYAMLMIDERWWNAAAHVEQCFKKHGSSAFEFANSLSFYQAYSAQKENFGLGMAAISLYEDTEVAQASISSLQAFEIIIDIGGGEGGLLAQIYRSFGKNKLYYLYDKSAPHSQATHSETEFLNFLQGDFLLPQESNNIPKHTNAAYFIKCVLHNMQKTEVITVLRNIRLAMKEGCQLFIAERVIPENNRRPQANLTCNLLMRMLFMAEAHDIAFYTEAIEAAGFNLNNITTAGNYMLFVATEKPELQFQKSPSSSWTINKSHKVEILPETKVNPQHSYSPRI